MDGGVALDPKHVRVLGGSRVREHAPNDLPLRLSGSLLHQRQLVRSDFLAVALVLEHRHDRRVRPAAGSVFCAWSLGH